MVRSKTGVLAERARRPKKRDDSQAVAAAGANIHCSSAGGTCIDGASIGDMMMGPNVAICVAMQLACTTGKPSILRTTSGIPLQRWRIGPDVEKANIYEYALKTGKALGELLHAEAFTLRPPTAASVVSCRHCSSFILLRRWPTM